MNSRLQPVYEQTLRLLQADPRVLAGFMTGSVGTPREDAYSDVDPVFLTRAEHFDSLDRELPEVFAQAGVEPFLWWPESINTDTWHNYAVFFLADGQPVQYDINLAVAAEGSRRAVTAEQFLFDKGDLLQVVPPTATVEGAPERLRWQVEIYWIYAYIHAKYLRRGDPFRLSAAQHHLLEAHLVMLQALHPALPRDWWAIAAGALEAPEERAALLAYLESPQAAAVAARLPEQMRRFARDARTACRRWGVEYPAAAEDHVRPYAQAAATERSAPGRGESPGRR